MLIWIGSHEACKRSRVKWNYIPILWPGLFWLKTTQVLDLFAARYKIHSIV